MTTITSKEGLPSDYVRAFAEDPEGAMWVGTDGEGVCRVSADTIISYGRENSGIDERVTSLAIDSAGVVWVGTYGGLFRFQRNGWTRFDRADGLSSDSVLSLHAADGELWVGTFGGGVTVRRGGKFTQVGRAEGLSGTSVTGIAGDTTHGIWISMLRGGVCRLWRGSVSVLPLEGKDRGAFPLSILLDREGSVWVGLQNEGLRRLRDAAFSWYQSGSTTFPDPVRSVMQDASGTIWAGTAAGLRRLRGDGTLEKLPLPDQPSNILSLAEGEGGILWIGTLGNGLFRFTGARFQRFPLGDHTTVWALFADGTGTVWAGTNSGLARIRGKSAATITHNHGGLSHDDVRAICRGNDGTLWVGTSYGLDKISHDSVSVMTRSNSAISNDVIAALHADADGDIWVGTFGGLNRIRNGTVTSFTTADGLPDDQVGMILEDDDGFLWIAGEKGLYRIAVAALNDYAEHLTRALHPVLFGRGDGLRDQGFAGAIQPAAWKSRDGSIWLAANGGLARTQPARLHVNSDPPPTVLEEMAADGRTYSVDSIPVLSYGTTQFEITYTAPAFVKPGEILFRYRLEGLTDDWITAGTRRTAYFTHIPPGSYTFQVSAARPNGAWGTSPASVVIEIRPPFWMTWWFRTAGVLLAATLVYAGYRRHRAGQRAERKRQEHVTRQLLEGQEAERKRIAAELHDGLGQNLMVIRNLALLGVKPGATPSDRSDTLKEIAATAGATLDDVRRIAHNLRPVNLERFGLTASLRSMLDTMSESTSLALDVGVDEIDGVLTQDEEIHFFRIIQEAMSNVLKHSASSTATVNILRHGETLHCLVEDHGKGFEPAARPPGLGLGDIGERTRMLGGTWTLHSRPGEGTRITIVIPGRIKA
ncbi:MAG TPA: two-component regulator propeller domain-containing protein [Bacteroidota bacterium]|nr:two-component regulator propeller domain-containing protein [Bacteroidota bacterium]